MVEGEQFKERFHPLLDKMDPDRNRAGEIYTSIHRRLVKFFQWRGCQEPERWADVTIDEVAKSIVAGKEINVSDPYLYCWGVARHVLSRCWQEQKRIKRLTETETETLIEDPTKAEQEDLESQLKEHKLSCMRQCLKKLSPTEYELIIQYYQEGNEKLKKVRKALAKKLGLKLINLRTRACRIRTKLVDCVEECVRPVKKELFGLR